ncbi:hypothetical protein TNCT_179571 [Trichonephila clavata]|uniref:Uncharacterized protein n=1 Tax=Trichonephila clavata TaxID=2740835 RepID=A0A8X6L5C8_TRICU|nr:hypothetical protein TNCT_179571 [Trichonephila clavata]
MQILDHLAPGQDAMSAGEHFVCVCGLYETTVRSIKKNETGVRKCLEMLLRKMKLLVCVLTTSTSYTRNSGKVKLEKCSGNMDKR